MDVVFEHVEHAYGRTRVLSDITWRITPGVVGLLGPNGAGKTTLLSLLVGLQRLEQGTITIGGHGLSTAAGRSAARQLLGFVPQRFSLVPEMRLQDTVAYAAWINGIDDIETAGFEALTEVGLDEHARTRVRTLSGGQRQRLGIAAALAHRPKVVVLDEPTVGLDPAQRLRVREMIAAIGEQRTVVLSSHLLEDVAHLCQHVGVLASGKLAFDGTIEQFQTALDSVDTTSSTLGSRFELAYEALLTRLGES